MPGDPNYCLSCMVYNDDYKKVKDYLDSYGLSESQAMCMARCLLRKATVDLDRLKNFLLKRGGKGGSKETKGGSKGNSESEMPLYWNGSVLCHADGLNNIQIMGSLLQVRHSNNWFNEPRFRCNCFYLLQMAVPLDNSGIAKALLRHLSQNTTQARSCGTMNNLETVKLLLHAGADINETLPDGLMALQVAIRLAKQEIYKVVWNPLYFNETPLYAAAATGNNIALKKLLQKNADIEERSYNDMTPLHIAAQLGHKLCAETLLEYGADINSLCAAALNKLLYDAVTFLREKLFGLLLRKGVDIKDGFKMRYIVGIRPCGCDVNKTMLDLVTERVRMAEVILKIDSEPGSLLSETQNKIVKSLVRCDFGEPYTEEDSLLHMVIRSGSPTIVKHLLNLGINCNARSRLPNGDTPLHTAVKNTHNDIARLLIQNHTDVNARDDNGKTPLHVLDSYCIQMNTDNRFKKKHHRDPSDAATFEECKELVELLLEHKADVNSVDAKKETPLHSAAKYGNEVMVKILLDKGATVNAKRTDGMTALHLAAMCGTRKGVNFLLDHGADINLLSNDGKTALDCTKHNFVADDLISRIIKIIALKHWVCDRNFLAINLLDASSPLTIDRRRPDCCIREVECMKQETIGNNVSYYDVLTQSMNQLVHYARNKDIVRTMEKGRHKRMFPLYSSMLYHRFKNGQERAGGLLDSSMESFRLLTGYYLPDLTITVLFDYLSNGDLKNVIEATRAMILSRQTKHEHSAGANCDLESTE